MICLVLHRQRHGLLAAFCLVSLLVFANESVGQGFFRPIGGMQSGRFLDAPRSIQQQLREAERSIDGGSYSDAVVRLGDLLQREAAVADDSELNGQDFFLDAADATAANQSVQESLLSRARSLIGSLPPKGKEIYELRYGALARKMLDDAALNRDWHIVAEVRRKYFHTLAGYDASLLLARREMLAGHPLYASLLLDEIVRTGSAIDYLGSSVRLLHAAACHAAGRDLTFYMDGEVPLPVGEVSIKGQSQTIPSEDELLTWLEKQFPARGQVNRSDGVDYPMFGGKPDRNGNDLGEMPLANERWMTDATASPRQARTLREVANSLTASGKLPPPSWTPIRVGDQVLMRTTERLVGVDFRSGKRIWMYPWFSPYKEFEAESLNFDVLLGDEDGADLISQRVWNDLPYGQITSDGERVFMITDLGEVEMVSFSPIMGMQGTRPSEKGANTLVALELATEGKLLWRLGKREDLASTLSDAFFLGPPLPLDGRLYVMAEIAGDILLLCLDPATGEELWRQLLVAVETGGVATDPIRRVAGAVPTYHEGVLICPTGAGSIVAIDLVDRTLRWGATYLRNDEMNRNISGRGRGMDSTELMQRWFSGAAVASEQSVLVTPIEADHLHGFDLLSGQPLFQEKNRLMSRLLAGIREGRFFLVGTNQVSAYETRTGKNLWTTGSDLLSVGQQISGQGVFGDSTYLLPTSTNELIKISLDTGEVIERRQLRFQLGNLIASEGELISQGPTTISVSYGETSLGPKVEQALKADPNDTQALVRKAELLLQSKQYRDALALLERAGASEPDNQEIRMLSVSAMLDLLRDSPSDSVDFAAKLERLIYQPDQRIELLALKIRSSIELQDYPAATTQLLELSSLLSSSADFEAVAARIVADPTRSCSLDAWIASRSALIAKASTQQQKIEMEQIVSRAIQAKLNASDGLLTRLHQQFRDLPGSKPIANELLQRMASSGEWLKATGLLQGRHIASKNQLRRLSEERLWELAETYTQCGFGDDAMLTIDLLRERQVDSQRLDELATVASSLQQATQQPKVSPQTARIEWEPLPSRMRATIGFSQRVSDTTLLSGEQFRGWKLVSEGAYAMAIRSPLGHPRGIPLEENSRQRDLGQNEALVSGAAMIIVTPSSLVAIDLHRLSSQDGDSVLWQHRLSSDASPLLKRGSSGTPFGDQVFYYRMNGTLARANVPRFSLGPILGDRVLFLQGGELVALDLFSGELLWRNANAPISGEVLSDSQNVVVVSDAENRIVFYNLLDGAKIEEKTWGRGQLWKAAGENVLAYQQSADDPRQFNVGLYNPFTDKVVLEHKLPQSNRTTQNTHAASGRIVDGRFLTLLDTLGNATVWDLVEAELISDAKLPAYEDLIDLHAMRMGRQLILLPMRRPKNNDLAPKPQLHTSQSNSHQTTDGVFAISLDTGLLRWQKSFDEAWGCTMHQPDAAPVLLLSRGRSIFPNQQSRTRTLDVLALSLQDGSEVGKVLDKEVPSNTNELETQIRVVPSSLQMSVEIGREQFELHFGDSKTDATAPDNE